MLKTTAITLASVLFATGAFAQNNGAEESSQSEPRTDSQRQNGGSGSDSTYDIMENGSREGFIGSSDNFTGTAYVEPVFSARGPFVVNAGKVTFLPGARSHWHTHPAGQMLIVTEGKGWIQIEGEERQEIEAGDTVWFPPNTNHWHGATDTTAVTHYAVQQYQDGENVVWGEPVNDEQYASAGE